MAKRIMPTDPPAIAEARRALAEMYIDLTLAFHATTERLHHKAGETDANLALVAVAAMLGHADGHAMNASQIAKRLKMPRTSVLRRLDILLDHAVLTQFEGRYYLSPHRARHVPHRDAFELILSKGLKALAPRLSEMDT